MKKIIYLIAFILAFLTVSSLSAQDFSNKGKDFWIAYTGHIDGTSSVMGLYLTSDVDATGSVQVGATNLPFSIKANQVTTLFLGPNSGGNAPNINVYNSQADGINPGYGIHVVSSKNIVVYAHIIRSARSGATLVLPTQVLGRDYIIPSYKNYGSSASYGQITVVAVQPQTTIEITPTTNDRNGNRPAGGSFRVTLAAAGDVYQLQSELNGDFSGSTVKSIATASGGCKPIAVYASTTWSGFDCTNASGGDNLYQQLFPTKSWGKKFVTAPFINKPYDIIRIFIQSPGTVVTKTEAGLTTQLANLDPRGNFYELKTRNPLVIEASTPVSVAQYITSQSCGGGNSDPEMTLINPVEQTLNDITLFSAHQGYVPAGQTQVTQHYINVVIPTSHKQTFRIDNNLPTAAFTDIPSSGYSFLQENVTSSSALNPVHNLHADTGFTAIVYGYGNVESYGYNAGTNVRDLYQFVTIQNQYASVNFPASCKGTPFYFAMTFPYQPTQIKWVFGAALNAMGITDIIDNAPVSDSTWIVNGKQLYRYKLQNPYIINTIGTYPIKVLAQNPTPDGCSGEQEIDYDVQVFDQPKADFNFQTNGCLSQPVQFTDASGATVRPINQYKWDFDDGSTSNIKNPSHLYGSVGPFKVKYNTINDIGCISSTVEKPILLSQSPVAKFTTTGTYCVNNVITFTDASTSTATSITKWHWNFGDGFPVVIATTNAAQTHAYTTPGTYTVTLKVETGSGCQSVLFSMPVTVSASPVAAFTFGNGCLPNAIIQFRDASAMSGTANTGTTYLWDFGDGTTSTAQNPQQTFTSAGPFSVKLSVTTNAGCTDDSTRIINSINAQPQAAFTAPQEVCFGTTVAFSDGSTVANGNITQWAWDLGDGTTSTLQNPTKNYTIPGTYMVKLTVTSAAGCTSPIAVKQVIVNKLPQADFTIQGPNCVTKSITYTDASTPNSGTITKWIWDLGDGTVLTRNDNLPFTHSYAATKTYVVTLKVETDKSCMSTLVSKNIVVNPLPVPDFTLPENCLSDPFSQFNDISTIADGTEAAFTYLWNFGDPNASALNQNTATQKNSRHKYSAARSYQVTQTVTSGAGCAATLTKTFTINGAVPQSVFTVNGGTDYCSDSDVSITNVSSVDVGSIIKLEIFWDIGDPSNKITDVTPATGKTYTYHYPEFFTPASKLVTIRVIAYSGDNCQHTSSQTITLKARPQIDFTSIGSICGDVPPFQITQARVINGVTGNGVFSGTGVSATGLFNPKGAGEGLHKILYTVTGNNGCISAKDQTVSVFGVPVVDAGPDRVILQGGSVVLLGTARGNGLAYLWTPNNRLSTINAVRPIAAPEEDITYKLTVTTADGCSNADFVNVKVLKTPAIPNTFSPNGDGIHDRWEIASLESYPGAAVQIFNRYGQIIFESKGYSKPWDGTYKGKPVPIGTYYYIIDPKNGRKQISGFVDIIR